MLVPGRIIIATEHQVYYLSPRGVLNTAQYIQWLPRGEGT